MGGLAAAGGSARAVLNLENGVAVDRSHSSSRRGRHARRPFQAAAIVLAVVLAAAAGPRLAHAQLMLPGATHARPPGGSDKSGGSSPARSRMATQKVPDASSIAGLDLVHDGRSGLMAFGLGSGKALEITSLSLDGEQISRPGGLCRVDVVAEAPIEPKAIGRRRGLLLYEVVIEACPFVFELLDGAVLVTRGPQGCEFAAADCRVDPTGLWGPRGDSMGEKEIAQFERARAQSEANMRANFRALLASAGKDKQMVKQIAAEQAGVSSERAMICRDYEREEMHGFCALKITQARVFDLQAQYEARASDQAGAAVAPLRGARSQATTDPRRAEPSR